MSPKKKERPVRDDGLKVHIYHEIVFVAACEIERIQEKNCPNHQVRKINRKLNLKVLILKYQEYKSQSWI